MSEIKINKEQLEDIVLSFQDLKQFVEGKKPIKPELVLHLINQLQIFNINLKGTSEVVNEFNTNYSTVLLEQIKKNNKTSFELEKLFGSVEGKVSKLIDLETRVENISAREDQVNELLKQVETTVEKIRDLDKILAGNEEVNNTLQATSIKIESNLSTINETVDSASLELTKQLEGLTAKSSTLDELRNTISAEKEQWGEKREAENLEYSKKLQELEAKEMLVDQRQKDMESQLSKIEKRENSLDEKEKNLLERENKLKELQIEINTAQKENKAVIDDIKLAQDKLFEDIQVATELIAEKKYIEKVEELIEQKQVEIKEKTDLINQEKETLNKALNNFASLLDKTENNLSLAEISAQSLNYNVEQLSIEFNNFTSQINELEVLNKNIKDERVRYEDLGDKLHGRVNEMDKQLEEILKLDVLSRYINQSTIELREAQVALNVLVKTSTKNVDKSNQLRKDITRFLGTATGLLDTAREQIEFSITSEKKLKDIRQELISEQFDLARVKSERDKVENVVLTKENYIAKLEDQIMEIEGKLVKAKLESSLPAEQKVKIGNAPKTSKEISDKPPSQSGQRKKIKKGSETKKTGKVTQKDKSDEKQKEVLKEKIKSQKKT
ncbi:MAG: hypothetical protein ACXAD7_05160 [Candidatus Kariarchaeaceae archaeon]|jgi:chromosome segregation ATPase